MIKLLEHEYDVVLTLKRRLTFPETSSFTLSQERENQNFERLPSHSKSTLNNSRCSITTCEIIQIEPAVLKVTEIVPRLPLTC